MPVRNPYGCFSRPPLLDFNTIPARWPGDEPLHIPNRMERGCQYTLHDKYNDQKCIGCAHHRGNRPATPKEDSHERTNTTK